MAVDSLLVEVAQALRQRGIVLVGLGEPELWQLERAVSARFPRCLRAMLTRAGLRTNPFGLYVAERDWVRANDRMYEQLHHALATGEIGPAGEIERLVHDEHLVAFAPRGAAGQMVLRGGDDEGRDLMVHEPGRGLESCGESFETWARRAWAETRARLGVVQERAIQFSFWSPNEWLIERLAVELGGALDATWSSPVESSTGMVSWEQCLYIDGRPFRVRRMEHPSWRVPMVSVLVADFDGDWVVAFREAFFRAGIEVKEVDLGPVEPPAPIRPSFRHA